MPKRSSVDVVAGKRKGRSTTSDTSAVKFPFGGVPYGGMLLKKPIIGHESHSSKAVVGAKKEKSEAPSCKAKKIKLKIGTENKNSEIPLKFEAKPLKSEAKDVQSETGLSGIDDVEADAVLRGEVEMFLKASEISFLMIFHVGVTSILTHSP